MSDSQVLLCGLKVRSGEGDFCLFSFEDLQSNSDLSLYFPDEKAAGLCDPSERVNVEAGADFNSFWPSKDPDQTRDQPHHLLNKEGPLEFLS